MLTLAEWVALSGAAVAIAGTFINARRSSSAVTSEAVMALSTLLKDFSELRDKLDASEDQEEDCQARLAEATRELARLREELKKWGRA